MIKKYEKGTFTSKYINSQTENVELTLSKPRGFGLALGEMNPGNIVLFAGGTGLYPFSDLIDLLYKSMIVEKGSSEMNVFLKNDPVLNEKPFKSFNFTLYLAVNTIEELHPVTLTQCEMLSEAGILLTYVKTKEMKIQEFKTKYPKIQTINDRFQHFIKPLANDPNLSQIYICGPTRFSKALLDELDNNLVETSKYRII